MSDLNELLNSLRGGAQLDSAGKFTLDFLKAAAPFRLFLKEYPAWPWLRLVQVAHQQGAEAIHFQLREHTLSCRFQARRWAQDWAASARWLLGQGAAPTRAAVADVLLGLCASSALEWRVGLTDAEQGSLTWTPQAGLRVSGDAGDDCQLVVQARFERPAWFGWGKSALTTIDAGLSQRCSMAPLPVFVNGMAVNNADWQSLPGLLHASVELTCPYETVGEILHWGPPQTSPECLLAAPSTQILRGACYLTPVGKILEEHPYEPRTLCIALRYPGPGPAKLTQVYRHQPLPEQPRLPLQSRLREGEAAEQWFLSGGPQWFLPNLSSLTAYDELEQPQAASLALLHRLIVPLGSVGTGQICLVRDGVVSDPLECELGYPGLIAITSDPRLRTDASGLKIIQDEAVEELCRELRPYYWPVIAEVRSLLDPPHSVVAGMAASYRLELLTRFSR